MLVLARDLNAGDRIRWYSTDLVVENVAIDCGVVTVTAGRERLIFLGFEKVELVDQGCS